MPQRRRLPHEVPAWVDAGSLFFITINLEQRKSAFLIKPEIAKSLIASAGHYHATGIWWIRLLVLMPDHLHALLAIPGEKTLPRVVSAWKSYQAKQLGVVWQSGFFDHRLRGWEALDEKAHYIRMNPVRAGLAENPEDWPYVWPP